MQANITAVGKFVPNKVITNIEFEKTLDTSHEWIVSRTGIEERRKLELAPTSQIKKSPFSDGIKANKAGLLIP